MTEQSVINNFLMVRVMAPTSRPFEGRAVSVTAVNKVGQFDVLAGHANFFSLLLPSDVTIDTGNQKLTVPISGGLIKVKNNEATLFVNITDVTTG